MKKLKKSTLKRLSYPETPRERAIRLVRLAFQATEGSTLERTLCVAARYLIAEAQKK
jgi:hypothetical protein